MLAGASREPLDSGVRVAYMVFFCAITGPIAGWLILFTLAPLLNWTGSWLGGRDKLIHALPGLDGWTKGRDMPAPAGRTFRELYRERQGTR